MLQIARLAPTQLGDSSALVHAFLLDQMSSEGGFQDRAGASDLYYTVFGLEGLVALQTSLPTERTSAYLARFGDGDGLDFVHLACLVRSWATLSHRDGLAVDGLLRRVEAYRSDDGGYAQVVGSARGTIYAAFLALGIYQDLGCALPHPEALLRAIESLRSRDGGYGNQPGLDQGITTTTAAAVLLRRYLDAPIDPQHGVWLLDRCHPHGGFFATPGAPIPDLLSTATALHALSTLHVPLAGILEPCLDFVDSLWTNRGGFYGSWADDALDCEYTYYGLLALGHLAVAGSAAEQRGSPSEQELRMVDQRVNDIGNG
jgi:prenyltransferase beta subunit